MTKARPLIVALATAGAVALAIALGLVGGQVSQRPRLVPVSDDVSVTDFAPGSVAGKLADALTGPARLAAGGLAGGAAVSYLKFRVDLPDGVPPKHAEIWVARDSGKLPPMVELSTVPWAAWEQRGLSAVNAPRLGGVVDSVFPTGYETALHFDVSDVIRQAGEYAFALTAPTGDSVGLFVAQESESGRAPTLTLQWETAAASASASLTAAALKQLPMRTGTVAPPQTGQQDLPLPGWLPRDATPVWMPETPRAPVPSGVETPSPPAPPSPTGGPPASLPPSPMAPPSPSDGPSGRPTEPPSPSQTVSRRPTTGPEPPYEPGCGVGVLMVPSCGVLWGVAPGAHTPVDHAVALRRFEQTTQRRQAVYHAYHRGDEIFPTPQEIELARDPDSPRILFLNWKPIRVSWHAIAHGDPWADAYLDRLADHIRATFPEQFFFTMHHEPENEVRTNPRLGMTAKDYADAFRYVVQRLRAHGVNNMITTMVYMAYIPWNIKSWFDDLYPGDDVVDWVGWDAYAYSVPGYGNGDFAEMMNRRSTTHPDWPGFYTWAARKHPDKPFMIAEWGVWYSPAYPAHQSEFFESVGRQMELFPRVKAMIYFETPGSQTGLDSRVHATSSGLSAYRQLGRMPVFQVRPGWISRPG